MACYRVAGSLALAGSETHAAALAGASALEFGLAAERGENPDEGIRKRAKDAVRMCRGNGTALDAVSELLESLLAWSAASPGHTPASSSASSSAGSSQPAASSPSGSSASASASGSASGSGSIVLAKAFLRRALDRTGRAKDNHLRALALALVGAHYVHTLVAQAAGVLRSARQLAAGLGAPAVKGPAPGGGGGGDGAVGNAVLGLSVGERYLGACMRGLLCPGTRGLTDGSAELYRRTGDAENARKQASANARLARAVERLRERGRGLAGGRAAGREDVMGADGEQG
jgi:hypothetical protein